MKTRQIALLVVLSVIGGSACQLLGYDQGKQAFGKRWIKYSAQGASDPQPTLNVASCEAFYDTSKTPASWMCSMNGTLPISWGVWKQNARLQAGTMCLLDWDTGNVLSCPGEYAYPTWIWDLTGPSNCYTNGCRGPL